MPTTITDDDIKRILAIFDADRGFFILAMHSLIEATLRKKYNKTDIAKTDYERADSSFNILLDMYKRDCKDLFYKKRQEEIEKYDEYRVHSYVDYNFPCAGLFSDHRFSNKVRHMFENIDVDTAYAFLANFIAFADLEKLNSPYLESLRDKLSEWNQFKSYKDEGENLKKMIKYVHQINCKKDWKKHFLEYEELKKKNVFLEEKYADAEKYQEYFSKIFFYSRSRIAYEKSISQLSDEQKNILSCIKSDNGDFLIKGAAGTGKSLVLLKAMEKFLHEDASIKFRFLVYNKNLEKYNKYVASLFNGEIPDESVSTTDVYLNKLLNIFYPSKKVYYSFAPKEKIRGKWVDIKNIWPDGAFDCITKLTLNDVFLEFNNFIWSNHITKEQYLGIGMDKITRTGLKVRLSENERQLVWTCLEKTEVLLLQSNIWPNNFAAKMILAAINDEKNKNIVDNIKVDYSFVDEAQDLSSVMLSIIKKTSKKSVILAGDANQSIYTRGFAWKNSGIDITSKRSRILHVNFRNSFQIHEFAEKYRTLTKKEKYLDKDSPIAYRPGLPVEYTVEIDDSKLLYNDIIMQVKKCIEDLSYESRNICIIAPNKNDFEDIQRKLTEININSQFIDDKTFTFKDSDGVRLCTMQTCKGLDFPVVLMLADHRPYYMHTNKSNEVESSVFDKRTIDEQFHDLIYVSLTRAMELLYVFVLEKSQENAKKYPPASAITDLLKLIKEEYDANN